MSHPIARGLKARYGEDYYSRLGRLAEALALGRFRPPPPRDATRDWIDGWRRARVAFEINRLTEGETP